jgi:hypothetical protein
MVNVCHFSCEKPMCSAYLFPKPKVSTYYSNSLLSWIIKLPPHCTCAPFLKVNNYIVNFCYSFCIQLFRSQKWQPTFQIHCSLEIVKNRPVQYKGVNVMKQWQISIIFVLKSPCLQFCLFPKPKVPTYFSNSPSGWIIK